MYPGGIVDSVVDLMWGNVPSTSGVLLPLRPAVDIRQC